MAPPRDEAELRDRLDALARTSLGALAASLGVALPLDARRSKGWAGQLVERALGATAGSRAEPDFPALGIELKTLPVGAAGRPLESTFVASLELGSFDRRWETSAVRKKLARVAWLPIEGDKAMPLGERRLGRGLIWSPSPDEEASLRADYEDLVELVDEGFGERITGHEGEALQLRPKAANAAALRWSVNADGASARTAPRAFYLRASFTHQILLRALRPAEGAPAKAGGGPEEIARPPAPVD